MSMDISSDRLAIIHNLLEEGKKIAAIKVYREAAPGLGLKQAKDAVDDIDAKRGGWIRNDKPPVDKVPLAADAELAELRTRMAAAATRTAPEPTLEELEEAPKPKPRKKAYGIQKFDKARADADTINRHHAESVIEQVDERTRYVATVCTMIDAMIANAPAGVDVTKVISTHLLTGRSA